jgi:hypothetical protein
VFDRFQLSETETGNIVIRESHPDSGEIIGLTEVPAQEWIDLKAKVIGEVGNASYANLISYITGLLVILENN